MNGLPLALRLARRELRAGLGGFRIFIACLALGVAAIAGVGSLSEAVVAGLNAEARTLLGGDVDLRLHNRMPTARQDAYIEAGSAAVSRVVAMRAMARPAADRTRRSLVELKAVDGAYPLVGTLDLVPLLGVSEALAGEGETWGAVVDRAVLVKLGIAIGEEIRIGEATFVVRAVILREPDRVASVFALGPRIMIATDALPATGLVQPGSQVHYSSRLLLPPGIDAGAWMEDIEAAFPEAGWRIRGIDQAAQGVERFVERMTLFLTFVGLTALLVGGIGVGNAVESYLDGKTATIATLKCLGAPGDLVFRMYLAQILVLTMVGIAIGLVVGVLVPVAGAWALEPWLPVKPALAIYPLPLFMASLFGLLTSMTFALWPLARARETPAASLFRDKVAPARGRPRLKYVMALAGCALALAALILLTAEEKRFALWFIGGSATTMVIFRAGGELIVRLARRLPRLPGPTLRLAIANIHRPGNSTSSLVLSVGLGLAVLVAVALIEGNLWRQINDRLPEVAPAFFFIDIQPHQAEDFDDALAAIPGTHGLRRVPTLRGRIVAIGGVEVEKVDIGPEARWAVRGDRVITYTSEMPDDTKLVTGEWWPADYRGLPRISLDANLARGFGVGVGDTLTLNVMGREIEATIANLRTIDWRSMRFDFAIIFAPGALEGAPQSHIAAVQAPPSAEEEVERTVTERFTNVSVISVRETLAAAARILAGIGTAVRGTSVLTITAGMLVLAGAVAAGRRRRVYDAVIFKVLGATRGTILRAFLTEYGILGLATAAIAVVVGSMTAWAVVTYVMQTDWVFLPGVAVTTAALCVLITVIVGFAGTWRALGQKASYHLRNQ